MTPSIRLINMVLDCKMPAKLAEFYAALTGGRTVHEMDFFSVVFLPGESVTICCQLDEDYTPPVWPGEAGQQLQMAHLDFGVEEMDASLAHAFSLGATKPEAQFWAPGHGGRWITLLDPEGHPFCLCEKEEN